MTRTVVNYIIDTLLAITILATGFIGLIMGFVITSDEDFLWGQSRHEWGYIHFYLSVALIAFVVAHFALHWGSLKLMSRRYVPRSFAAWTAAVLILAAAAVYAGWRITPPGASVGAAHARPGLSAFPGYGSDGARIYLTNTDAAGHRIPFTGGPPWLVAHAGSCVDCHADNGQGGIAVIPGGGVAPDIRYGVLTWQEHPSPQGATEHERTPYDDMAIKRAITDGLDADGQPLDPTMPRYRMSDQDLDDVIDYLKEFDRRK